MAEWFSHNLSTVILAAGSVLLAFAGWKLLAYRVAQLEEWKKKHVEQSEVDQTRLGTKLDGMDRTVQSHVSNTTLHIDPNRDKAIWEEFKEGNRREFETINRKLDALMVAQPPHAVG